MDFKIEGDKFPILMCRMNPGEQLLAQSNNIAWYTKGIRKINQNKNIKNAIFGTNDILNIYQAHFDNQEMSGTISPMVLNKETIISEKSLLASEVTIENELFYQKKPGLKLFNNADFKLLVLKGKGKIFLQINGDLHEKELTGGDKLIVSPGHLVGLDYTCRVSLEPADNLKGFFIDEGMSNIVIYGPGKVYLQTMSVDKIRKITVEEK